jgi:hypothetical protein
LSNRRRANQFVDDRKYSPGTAEGIIDGSLSDFALSSDKLWMISDGQPLSLDLDNLPQKKPNLNVYIDSIVFPDRIVENDAFQKFSYDQNEFSFFVAFRGIEYESETTILYRMVGFENEWRAIPSTSDLIQFKCLPPGKYTFEVKVKYRNSYSEIKRYRFEIILPFLIREWFCLLVGIGFGALIFLLYLIQIRRMAHGNTERLEKQKIQGRQGNLHESFALDAINKRLSILQEQHGKQVGYVIHDLFENEVSMGTKVVITMPYMDQF